MVFNLDLESRELLSQVGNGVLLGVVQISSRILFVFRADHNISADDRVFPGHRELLSANVIKANECWGFSFQLKEGKITRFYRNSMLNSQLPKFCISIEEMSDIIEALGVDTAEDFQYFP